MTCQASTVVNNSQGILVVSNATVRFEALDVHPRLVVLVDVTMPIGLTAVVEHGSTMTTGCIPNCTSVATLFSPPDGRPA